MVDIFVIAPFLSRASDTAPVAEPFEIRFSPSASVYRVALNNDEHLYDSQVGQSGLSTEPHLHFEVVSDPDVVKQRGLPVFFYGLEDEEGPKFLRQGEFVRRVNQGFGKTN